MGRRRAANFYSDFGKDARTAQAFDKIASQRGRHIAVERRKNAERGQGFV
jgi:hypothetical protein